MTKPVPKFPDPDGPMPSKGLRPDKASYLQRFPKISKITLISLAHFYYLLLLDKITWILGALLITFVGKR